MYVAVNLESLKNTWEVLCVPSLFQGPSYMTSLLPERSLFWVVRGESYSHCVCDTLLWYLWPTERALYSMECAFHPLFSLTSGTCRLDYRRPENRWVWSTLKWVMGCFQVTWVTIVSLVGNRWCKTVPEDGSGSWRSRVPCKLWCASQQRAGLREPGIRLVQN